MADATNDGYPKPGFFAISTAVYAQREGKMLVLKRAGGELTGAWYLPGGAVDEGEEIEPAARRELLEESGLLPAGPLTLIGVSLVMRLYGSDNVQIGYACDCPDGEVVLSAEHSEARWVDPAEYRERYLADAYIESVRAHDARIARVMEAVRENLDRYIAWAAAR